MITATRQEKQCCNKTVSPVAACAPEGLLILVPSMVTVPITDPFLLPGGDLSFPSCPVDQFSLFLNFIDMESSRIFFKHFKSLFIFERERERERERDAEQEWGRGRETPRPRLQSRLQALSCQH